MEIEEDFTEINTKISESQILTQKHAKTKEVDPKKLVPQEFHEFLHLFSQKKSEQFPPEWP